MPEERRRPSRRRPSADLSPEEFRSLIDLAPVGIYCSDVSGRLLYANQALALIFNFHSVAEFIAQGVLPRYKDPEARALMIERLRAEGKVYGFEMDGTTKDGETRRLLINASLHEGRLSGMIRDITHQRALEARVRLMDSVLEQADESVIVSDPEGTIVYVNASSERTSGYLRSELLGRKPSVLKSGAQKPIFYEELWKAIRSGKVWTGVLINRRKDGALYHEDATISPIRDGAGRITHFAAIKRDVTDKAELQERMTRSERLASAGLISAGVAHEVNNPLSNILGLAQLLLDAGGLTESQRQDLEAIAANAQRAGRITRSLLQFSRSTPPSKARWGVDELIERTLLLLKAPLAKSGVSVAVRVPRPAPALWADLDQLQQLLINLILNSRDAMADSAAKDLLVCAERAPGRVLLKVQDSGSGIPAEILPRIFDPFFTTKPVGQGTGLGLPICYGIAVEHGGVIRADNLPGGGCAFTVELPDPDS